MITPELYEEAQMCARAAETVVEGYLKKEDPAGANEYMDMFLQLAGRRAHDTVMKLIQYLVGSPDWRTFS